MGRLAKLVVSLGVVLGMVSEHLAVTRRYQTLTAGFPVNHVAVASRSAARRRAAGSRHHQGSSRGRRRNRSLIRSLTGSSAGQI